MITQEYVNEFFEYKNNDLVWKKPISNLSRVKIGSQAGCFDKSSGYKRLKLNNKSYLNHRIIFLMHKGYLPKYIDHIDGNIKNNAIENLREATHSENLCNQKKPSHNKSGIKGVSWVSKLNKWHVQLKVGKKKKHFGYYFDIEVAKFVSETMRYKYHKEFANHG
jgi:hypothetical protein